MADNKEAQLDKLEAEKQKHLDAIAKIDTQIDAIRAELRSTVLAQTKQQAAAYALTPEEIFGAIATAKAKAKAAPKAAAATDEAPAKKAAPKKAAAKSSDDAAE
mgnify:CR=1 FL=1